MRVYHITCPYPSHQHFVTIKAEWLGVFCLPDSLFLEALNDDRSAARLAEKETTLGLMLVGMP